MMGGKIVIFAAIVAALQIVFALCIRKALGFLRDGDGTTGLLYLVGGVSGVIGSSVIGYLNIAALLE